jgi:hypothetical protein
MVFGLKTQKKKPDVEELISHTEKVVRQMNHLSWQTERMTNEIAKLEAEIGELIPREKNEQTPGAPQRQEQQQPAQRPAAAAGAGKPSEAAGGQQAHGQKMPEGKPAAAAKAPQEGKPPEKKPEEKKPAGAVTKQRVGHFEVSELK